MCDACGLDACGCCEPQVPESSVLNRAGLPALTYRAGTYATFLRRMLARIPTQEVPAGAAAGTRPLQLLTTRAQDDAAIALLDAWAVTADVLTFYQERIANEGFLGTAVERRSVLELARAIGYELNPGVAASTYIAFHVEEPPPVPVVEELQVRTLQANAGSMAPTRAIVAAGTQVQSVPGPGEKPQTFETSVESQARPDWNAIRPRLTQAQPLNPSAKSIWVEGTVTDIKAGGRLLFLTRAADNAPVLPTAKTVVAVTVEDKLKRTRLDIADATATPAFQPPVKSLLLFAIPTLFKVAFTGSAVSNLVLGKAWRAQDLQAFTGAQRWDTRAVARFARTLRVKRGLPPAPTFTLDPIEPGLVAFTQRVAAFGHNAPKWASLPVSQRHTPSQVPPGDPNAPYTSSWDGNNEPTIAENSQGSVYRPSGSSNPHFFLERAVAEVQPASWLLLEGGGAPVPLRVQSVSEASLADFALSGRATGVVVRKADDSGVAAADLDGFKVRSTAVHAASRPLALAQLPIAEDIGAGTQEASQLTLDTLVLDLTPGRAIAVTGERADMDGVVTSEVVLLSDVVHADGFTTLFFKTALQQRYLRASATLNANVVAATHGETVNEVLGSGNGTSANQRFQPKKPPLTYVSSSDASGRASTMQVRVNDVLWAEVPSLYAQPANARVYITRLADDGKISVTFGDGLQGARLPTGAENIVARYRTGIGLAGEVAAGALTVLQVRPLGIREASNPVPASGAEDPETLATARGNAPLTVRTLDRIVSLRDYADFTRGFAGIGKADAVALWDGRRRVVAITIGTASGEPVDPTSALFTNLVAAIAAASTAMDPVFVTSFQPAYFNISAKLRIDRAYQPAKVIAQAGALLLEQFSFAARCFGQAVTAAEIMAVLHRIEGVIAVDLDALFRVDESGSGTPTASVLLLAGNAQWDTDHVALAELLLVNPAGITLVEMQP